MVSGWINPESMTIRDCIALFVPLVTPPKEPGSRYDSIALVSLMTGSSQIRVLLALIALVGTAQAEIRDFASPVTAQARDFQASACPLHQSGCQENTFWRFLDRNGP